MGEVFYAFCAVKLEVVILKVFKKVMILMVVVCLSLVKEPYQRDWCWIEVNFPRLDGSIIEPYAKMIRELEAVLRALFLLRTR